MNRRYRSSAVLDSFELDEFLDRAIDEAMLDQTIDSAIADLLTSSTGLTDFKRRVQEIALREWELFNRGTKKEYEEGAYQRVGDYWKGLGLNYDGRNRDWYWSAAFISWVMKQAGAGNQFKYSSLHADYIRDAIQKRKSNDQNAAFKGYRIDEIAPQVGDLVCTSRGIDAGIAGYDTTRDYQAHCDIVVATRPNEIEVIGGNVSDSVSKKTLKTDSQGKVIDTRDHWFVVITPVVSPLPTYPVVPPSVASPLKINLSGSVGAGGINNTKDIIAVKNRLHALGFAFFGNPNDSAINTGFITTIKLFQSIIAGRSTITGDGRVDVGGVTHLWLQAANAPRWVTMPDSNPSLSFRNYEKEQTSDDHDFGTSWLADAILEIAVDYHNTHVITTNPGAAHFTINDVSRPQGGDTLDHEGHETGLMCDVRLPRTDGQTGGITHLSSNFDRNATRALIKSMRRQKLVRAVLFNDPTLMSETFMSKPLCTYSKGHDNHIHFEINPPVRA